MIVETPVDFRAKLPLRARLIGLDVGTKTIGIAVSDPALRIATPRTTLKRRRFTDDIVDLRAIVSEIGAGGIVIGLPVSMDGTEGPRAQSVRAFARNLSKAIDVPIAFWDERLSTAAVERALIDLDVSRSKRAKVIDAHAAAYILQGMLDSFTAQQQRSA
ncbi:MAG: Holliday junction resolvase RuvX [Alphaproteobacteria bacterium]|nr:Holliday junction resolvase RuvX [Alphaproteobacteria bacterium]